MASKKAKVYWNEKNSTFAGSAVSLVQICHVKTESTMETGAFVRRPVENGTL